MLQAFSEMPQGITLPDIKPDAEEAKTTEAAVARPEETPAISTETPGALPPSFKKSAILEAGDLLHGGNAIVAAQEEAARAKAAPQTPQKQEEEEEGPGSEPFERNLREVGLKEALPHQTKAAPERIDAMRKAGEGGVPRIRTYAEDMGTEIEKRGATISSIVSAEKARAPVSSTAEAPKKRRGLLFAAGALLLIALGGGALAAALLLAPKAPVEVATQSIIPVNSRTTLAVDDLSTLSDALGARRAGDALALGDVEEIDVTRDGAPVSAYDILTALGAPNELARNATGIWIGVHAFNHTQPFMLISVSAYDRAFAAMLSWESTMADSLGAFFAPPWAPTGVTAHAPTLSFSDTVTANLDVRESGTEWPIVYAFPRRDLILITTNENTLREIVTRLSLGSSSSQ
jgi:hypothetical protein